MDAETALAAARKCDFYLGHSDFVAKTEWKSGVTGSGAEDILVDLKGDPVVCCVVGTLQPEDFFLSPHCGFDPGRIPAWQVSKGPLRAFTESKGSALIGAVPSLMDEFKEYTKNLETLFSAIMPYTDQSGMIVKRGDRRFFKVTHQMFSLREGISAEDIPPNLVESGTDSGDHHVYDSEIIPAFRMANWPVPESCVRLRNAMVKTHCVNPIPAFMDGNSHPLIPSNYVGCLRGAIVQIAFTISHKVLRRKIPISFFTATIDEITILKVHTPADLSPSKTRLSTRFLLNPPEGEPPAEVNPGRVNKRRRT
ncbi:hypothetical protein RhiJN_18308 [Ceratobasidium sp. AG-Ba]|nr:hypothetical protein RhiJN_18308 [Ceratobasidium sp. AG-Ba]